MNTLPTRRWSWRLAGAAAALALVTGFTVAPASAARPEPVYVALGDSYAAGTGGGQYIAPPAGLPESCLQTAASYPADRGAALNLGCFGATTSDVAAVAGLRASALATATVVTVTVGGNDVDTGQVAQACTAPGGSGSTACNAALFNSLAIKLPALPGKIKAMLTTLKDKAPKARIVLTGYPRLFTLGAGLTPEQTRAARSMNAAADLLNATIAFSALVNRVGYVSVSEKFAGHGIGSAAPWIVAPSGFCNAAYNCSPSPFDAFHPTAAGYAGGYAAALAGARIP